MTDDMYYKNSAKDRLVNGQFYHILWDPPLAEVRRQVIDYIPEGASVLDIACGTGELCFDLAKERNCRVTGLDLSKRMIAFASGRNRYPNVHFVLGDTANVKDYKPRTFDFATIVLLLHEIPKSIRISAIQEALRVAGKTIIIDSLAPLPANIHGIALRIVEAIGGPQHYRSFKDFLDFGGISGVLENCPINATVVHRSVIWHGCREMVVLESHNH
ncbi:MAG: class I SAM-dependent methyltransferase [Candidatus Zixiibacteriota bacterium]